MTPEQFEFTLCDILAHMGYWAHRMAKDRTGAQPFDIIAMYGGYVLAVDCKVISTERPYFPFDRIEWNQQSAFEVMSARTNADTGFAILYKGNIYLYRYKEIREMMKTRKSLILDTWHEWLSAEKIFDIIGKRLG